MTQTAQGRVNGPDELCERAPRLRRFVDAIARNDETGEAPSYSSLVLIGTFGLVIGGHHVFRDTPEKRVEKMIAENTVDGVYVMPSLNYTLAHAMLETGAWQTPDETPALLPDRMSPAAVRALPSRVDRTQALLTVAAEQVPNFNAASMASFAERYHLTGPDLAALATTKPSSERGLFTTPGLTEMDVHRAAALGHDLHQLKSETLSLVEQVDRSDLSDSIRDLSREELARFAATFGETSSKEIVARGGDMSLARDLASLSISGMQSLYLQRSPRSLGENDHPEGWVASSARARQAPVTSKTNKGVVR